MKRSMNIRALFMVLALVALGACSSDDEPSEKPNPFMPGTNNATNNSTNNMIGTMCETEEDCAQPADFCRESVAVTFTGNGICQSDTKLCNFFFVTEEQECTLTQQSCESGACVDNACTGVECTQPSDRCEGNTLVYYPEPSMCSVASGQCETEEFRLDCVMEGGECMFNTCVGACVGVMCDMPPAAFCDSMTAEAVSYGAGMCNPDDGTCSYTETRTACVAPQVCLNGACVNDPCANVDCTTPPADSCVNNMAVTYNGAGVCDPMNGMCDYSGAETTVDCLAETCIDAACVDTSIGANDLVIVEIMHDPEVVADDLGEYFEVINTSTRMLNLDGIEITSTGDLGYTAMLGQVTLLMPGERYVFGTNSDLATNGGVTVDLQYTDIMLDAVDALTLMSGATVVDTVTWDATWPATPGAAMTFGSEYDPLVDDNATNTFWCDATTLIGGGTDLGTPAAANDTCM